MILLGLTTLGDAAAALLRDGELVAAAEEERFSRTKHHSGFPEQAIRFCLETAGVTLAEVDRVGHYWKPWVLRHKALETLKTAFFSRAMFRARVDRGIAQVSDSYLGMLGLGSLLRDRFGPSRFRLHFLEHHLCHAASAFFVSPFETAAILTMDGTGEDTTTLLSRGVDRRIHPLQRVKLPHSMGQFYSAVTNFLGFDMMAGDEWKVMGLAAYGEPRFADYLLAQVVPARPDGTYRVNIRILDHHLAKHYRFSDELVRVLGPPRKPDEPVSERHQDIAASAQRALEERVLALLRGLHRRTGEERLCLAGGVAFNSVLNGRILRESPFREVFIQPAAGDAGCSIGAAFQLHHGVLNQPRSFRMRHAYWGPRFSSEECAAELTEEGLAFETLPDEELLPRVARLIADGAVVGWFQGRMEFGPRALGARSFLADPRRADMRELLNRKVKLREWFRPLAPSLPEESAGLLFGRPHRDPFMLTVLDVAKEMRDRIPAVVHVDGSARAQTVSREDNPRYWRLLREFERVSGVPALLNTSFNVQEPIVCRPADAIRTFRAAGFDALVLEEHLVLREPRCAG